MMDFNHTSHCTSIRSTAGSVIHTATDMVAPASTDSSPQDPAPKKPRRLPQEWPADQERYTEEIIASSPTERARNVVAIDRIELINTPHSGVPYVEPSQADFSRNAAELTEAETSPDPDLSYSERTAKQTSDYHEENKAAPNNNLFFEERSNPLSSKGN